MMIDLEASKIRATNAALGQGLTALPSHTPQQSSIGMSWQHARCAMINLTHPFSLSLSLSLSVSLSPSQWQTRATVTSMHSHMRSIIFISGNVVSNNTTINLIQPVTAEQLLM
jgi:hypothetical protein